MSRGEEFGIGRDEQHRMMARAYADHIADGMAQAAGFHDWDHMATSQRNDAEVAFRDKYASGGRGRVRWDADRDTHVYEVRHPSGWVGVHVGPHTEMSHVTTPGQAHDMWSYSDPTRHGLLSPMQPEEWPSPAQVDRDVHQWVEEHGREYEEHALGRRP